MQFGSFLTCVSYPKEHHFSISQQFPVLRYLGFHWGLGRGRDRVSHGAEAALCPLAPVPVVTPLPEERRWGSLAWPRCPLTVGPCSPLAGPDPSEGHTWLWFWPSGQCLRCGCRGWRYGRSCPSPLRGLHGGTGRRVPRRAAPYLELKADPLAVEAGRTFGMSWAWPAAGQLGLEG